MTDLTDKLASTLMPIGFGTAMIVAGIWLFDSGDASRVCAQGSCNSGAAVALSVIVFGAIFTLAGLRALVAPVLRRSIKPDSPYGPAALHAERLRKMGVSEAQIEAELRKYRG